MEEKPIAKATTSPYSHNSPRSLCENLISSPNHFSVHHSPFLAPIEIIHMQGKENNYHNIVKTFSNTKSNTPKTLHILENIQNFKVIACELLHSGFLENAAQKALECKQLILKHIGSFNDDLIYIHILLGESMTHMGKFKEAKLNFLEAKKIVDGLFKSKHNIRVRALYSIQIFNDLGYLMKLQGKYKQAIEFYRKHLVEKLKYYNENTNEVATAYTQLGVVYSQIGSFENSMECLNKALFIREKVFGKYHLETATVYNNIGNVHLYIGDFHRAYQYYRLGEGILETSSLTDHPDYATSLVNMATCLKSLKQHEEAIILYEKALTIRERILGERHSSTVSCYLMIGSLYASVGQFEKAEEYLHHGTLIKEQEVGTNHVEIAICYVYLGNLKQQCKAVEEAIRYYNKAKEIYVQNYGENHPETILVYENISSLLIVIGKSVDALDLLFRVLKHKQTYYGESHPSTGTVLNNIGNILRQQGRNEEAFEMYQKCRSIYENFFGFDHEANAIVYTNLGHLYYSSFFNNSPDEKIVRYLLLHKSNVQDSQIRELKIHEALKLYTHAKSIRERVFGTTHIETIISYRNISRIYAALKNYPLAYQFIGNCKKLLTIHHVGNEAEMKETSKVMADILRDSGGKVLKKPSGDCTPSPPSSTRSQVTSKVASMNTLLGSETCPSFSRQLSDNTICSNVTFRIKDQKKAKDPTLYQSVLSKNRTIKTFR